MKTLVIGFKTGIGKAIFKLVGNDGISKSTGFDIDKNSTYNFNKYDCIVLNAYSNFTSQLKTMINILEYIDKNKLLIVVSSTSAKKTNPDNFYWLKYYVEKNAINLTAQHAISMGYNVSIISPATVDTYRNENKKISKLSPKDIATSVKYIISQFKKNILIDFLEVRTKK